MTDTDPKSLIRIARENGDAATAEPLDLGARVRATVVHAALKGSSERAYGGDPVR